MSTLLPTAPAAAGKSPPHPAAKKWTRREIYRLQDKGWFNNQSIELIDGEIILLPFQSPEHAYSVDEVFRILDRKCGTGSWVRMQLPIATTVYLEAAPDVSVVLGTKQDYSDHPSTAELIVEISKSTLEYDRRQKSGNYASANVPDYWIVNLIDRVLEVYRDPQGDASNVYGHSYATVNSIDAAGSITPLALPNVSLAVKSFLPPG